MVVEVWGSQSIKSKRTISDIVHGQVLVFHPIDLIIDTPEFQRLRNIEQLGFASYVYPSAKYSRFSHSLGVYHLARKFAVELRQSFPDQFTNNDVICVSIAGLIHDLGHGPNSHFYEHFLHQMGVTGFKHEEMSCKIWDQMLSQNSKLKAALDQYLEPSDYEFIKELINPPKRPSLGDGNANNNDNGWPMLSREKAVLYEIVSNPYTGLDVDKIDYILRDSMLTKVGNRLSLNDWAHVLCNSMRVMRHPLEERHCIAFARKYYDEVQKIFDDRMKLHEVVYQHKTTLAVEMMMAKVLEAANDHLLFEGDCDDREQYKLTDAFQNVSAFLQIDDGILGNIVYLAKTVPGLRKARDLLQQIERRELPKLIAKIKLNTATTEDKHSICNKIKQQLEQFEPELELKNSLFVRAVSLDQGKGLKKSPMNKIVFYEKDEDEAIIVPVETKTTIGGSLWAYVFIDFAKLELKKMAESAISALIQTKPNYLCASSPQKRALVEENGGNAGPESTPVKLFSLYVQPEEKRIKFEEEEDNVDTTKSKEDEQTENEESTGTSSGNSSYEMIG